MNEMVATGFEQWRELENEGVIKFGFVDSPQNADILVFFTDRFVGAAGPGGTDVHALTMGQVFTGEQVTQKIARGEPVVPIVMELKVNEDAARLQADAAHEFGHALGIKAHSPYREDIMYENRIVDVLSPSDKATLRKLYRTIPRYWYY
jgi:predicted Zn-dependent protease